MRFLEKSHDGGQGSGVTGYFLIEIKSMFSIVLIRFQNGTRDAFHNHAFNAVTIWLKGRVFEHILDGTSNHWKAGDIKYTPRSCFHKVEARGTAWALCFRGPWSKTWKEFSKDKFTTLTHGRKVVEE